MHAIPQFILQAVSAAVSSEAAGPGRAWKILRLAV